MMGVFFAAAYGRRHGLDFGVVTSEVALQSGTNRRYLRQIEKQVQAGDYTVTGASVKVYLDALEALAEDMADRDFGNPMFASVVDVLRGATSAGHGEDEFAVLYQLFSDQAL
jgi:3-hydroxyisobutyrate dehydrogenase-like beta-hydroxyacid dehydrogenase